MNRSKINILKVAVLASALVVALVVMPAQVGSTLRQFGDVAAGAAHQMHNGYMRLFN